MGLRLKKSIKLGSGAKVNLSKSGVGFSVGTKGIRKTYKAGGGTRTSFTVPGTGISYANDKSTTKTQRETMTNGNNTRSSKQDPSNKRKTWLWVLGWIFIFPLPLTILLLRKKEMKASAKYGIIAGAWIIYLIIGIAAGKGSTENNNRGIIESQSTEMTRTDNTTGTASESHNVTAVNFLDSNDVTVKIGEKTKTGTIKVTVKGFASFSAEDVQLLSENEEIAVISFIKSSGKNIYYEIEGVKAGETFVYAISKDGSVSSQKVKVVVLAPIEVDNISIDMPDNSLALGEKVKATAVISPENAENKKITWISSNMEVATIDANGFITGVSGGTTTITAKAENGVSTTTEVTVDGSKRLMGVSVSYPRDDKINIGDQWIYTTEINGEKVGYERVIRVGDTLTCSAKFTESDDNPDVGEASKSYVVTEADILNGFTVSMDLYVTENGGPNRGKSAHFVVTFSFAGK